MTHVGYDRVSTSDQHPEAQSDRLIAAGCERVFTDKGVSGTLARRPQWDKCLEYLRPGDVLVTVRLDRIGRSLRNLLEVMNDLGERGIDLPGASIRPPIDTTTPGGRLIFAVLAAIAEFERDLIRERTMDGLAAARARGRVGGRRRKLTDSQVHLARRLYDELGDDGKRAHTVQYIADMLKVDRTAVYRALERAEEAGSTASTLACAASSPYRRRDTGGCGGSPPSRRGRAASAKPVMGICPDTGLLLCQLASRPPEVRHGLMGADVAPLLSALLVA